MSDMISKDALHYNMTMKRLELYKKDMSLNEFIRGFSFAIEFVNSLPPANNDQTAKAEMLEEPVSTSMTWEGKCSNCGSYTIHEMNYCFGCGAKLYWGE